MDDGKQVVQESEIIERVPGEAYGCVSTSAGVRFESRASFSAGQDSTTVLITMRARATTGLAKILLPLVWLFAGPAAKANLEDDLRQLKDAIELETV